MVLLWLAFYVLVIYLWVLGIINAVTMKIKPLPYIGEYAEKIKL